MAKRNYNFFYLLLVYLFANSSLLVTILYEVHHNQASLRDIRVIVYSSFLINLFFILATLIYMIFRLKQERDINPARQTLLQSSLFQAIMDKVRVGVIITDSNGIIKFANNQASHITEFNNEEMLDKHYSKIFSLLHDNREQNRKFIIEKALENGCVVSNKLPRTIICKNNRKKDILSSANPIFDKDGVLTGVLLSFLDITNDFAKIGRISQENRNLNVILSFAGICHFKKNLITGKISGSNNLSHCWAFHSDNTAYSDEEWVYADDLQLYQTRMQEFINSEAKDAEFIYRSNFYSEIRYFHQILFKTENKNIVFGTIQDITPFINIGSTDVDISKVKSIGVNEKIRPKAKKLSILIVDHEINNCNVLALTFTKLNYYVRVTTTPNSALEYLKNCKVDIVITNLELPNMNGMEFAKELRIRYGFDVIIYVILNDISLQSKINLNLFNGILIKPITLEQIKKIF